MLQTLLTTFTAVEGAEHRIVSCRFHKLCGTSPNRCVGFRSNSPDHTLMHVALVSPVLSRYKWVYPNCRLSSTTSTSNFWSGGSPLTTLLFSYMVSLKLDGLRALLWYASDMPDSVYVVRMLLPLRLSSWLIRIIQVLRNGDILSLHVPNHTTPARRGDTVIDCEVMLTSQAVCGFPSSNRLPLRYFFRFRLLLLLTA
jgi:hypothetical protein